MLGFALMLVRVENCLFICFYFKCFYIFVFDQSFLVFMLKIQKHIKIAKPKRVVWHRCVLSQNMFFLVPLYKWPCAFKSVACSLSTPYLCGRNLDIYVIVINRSSNLSWMSSQQYCWSWDMHKLAPIYLLTHLFYCFCLKEVTKCKSPNEKRYWAAKTCRTY